MSGVARDVPGMEATPSLRASARRSYTEQEVLTESPRQLVLTVFDLILEAARKSDAEQVRQGLQDLLDSLDYRYETAWEFQALYDACLALTEQGQLAEVHSILHELRDAWAKTFQMDFTAARPTPFLRTAQRSGFEARV